MMKLRWNLHLIDLESVVYKMTVAHSTPLMESISCVFFPSKCAFSFRLLSCSRVGRVLLVWERWWDSPPALAPLLAHRAAAASFAPFSLLFSLLQSKIIIKKFHRSDQEGHCITIARRILGLLPVVDRNILVRSSSEGFNRTRKFSSGGTFV